MHLVSLIVWFFVAVSFIAFILLLFACVRSAQLAHPHL